MTLWFNCFAWLFVALLKLQNWDLHQLNYLFIENVGNLVCPSSYDLGEELRAVLLSVTEGEDKPLKYPTIFHSADAAIVTKTDLAEIVGFHWDAAVRNIESVRPGMKVLRVSAKTGCGMSDWLQFLADTMTTHEKSTNAVSARK